MQVQRHYKRLVDKRVIDILRDEAEGDEGNEAGVAHMDILVWEPHEDRTPQWLLDHIEASADIIDQAIKSVVGF